MTERELIVHLAQQDIGRREQPKGSNIVPGISDGQMWCALWICELLNAVGVACPRIASARRLVEHWQKNGAPIPATSAPLLPGDLVLTRRHDKDGHVVGDHVAIVEVDTGVGNPIVIAGNHNDEVARYEQDRSKIVEVARVVAE